MSTTAAKTSEPARPARVDTIDYAKGVGILLVVMAHVWRGLEGRITMPALLATDGPVDRWVYGFHMPLFFVVSGLFLYRSAGKPTKTFLGEKASTLLWPYLLWSVIYWQLGRFTSSESSPSPAQFSVALGTKPVGHLWFLWTLILIAIATLLLRKLRFPAWAVFLVAVGIYVGTRTWQWETRLASLLHAPVAGPVFQFAMFFPYVAAAGMLAAPLLQACARSPLWLWVVISVVGAAVVTYETRSGTADGQMFNFVSGAAGTLMVLGFARVLEHDKAWPIRTLGRYSLEIYLVHILAAAATRIVLLKLCHVTEWWVHLPAGIVAGVAVPLLLAVCLEKLRFPFVFRLPDFGENRPRPSGLP